MDMGPILFVAAPFVVAATVTFVLEAYWPTPAQDDKQKRSPKRSTADDTVDKAASPRQVNGPAARKMREEARREERVLAHEPEEEVRSFVEEPSFEMPANFELAEYRSGATD